jgi:hypothetical protein
MPHITYFALMDLVGAFITADILTACRWTKPFTNFMASIVPQINKVTATEKRVEAFDIKTDRSLVENATNDACIRSAA